MQVCLNYQPGRKVALFLHIIRLFEGYNRVFGEHITIYVNFKIIAGGAAQHLTGVFQLLPFPLFAGSLTLQNRQSEPLHAPAAESQSAGASVVT